MVFLWLQAEESDTLLLSEGGDTVEVEFLVNFPVRFYCKDTPPGETCSLHIVAEFENKDRDKRCQGDDILPQAVVSMGDQMGASAMSCGVEVGNSYIPDSVVTFVKLTAPLSPVRLYL